jgi:hypothetical protein
MAGLPGDCACALPCGEASFKLDELVRGPGVDHEMRLKSNITYALGLDPSC